jgi:hypothetical protein
MTARPTSPARHAARGAATVEFALVVPLLITMVMFSMLFFEVARAKLKLQEAARYITWEMTSYALTDFGNEGSVGSGDANHHDRAFELAREEAIAEATERYRDLDSIEDEARFSFIADYSGITFQVENLEAPTLNSPFEPEGSGPEGFVERVLATLNGGLARVLGFWGFNPKAKAQGTVTARMHNRLFGRRYLNDGFFSVDHWGGRDLGNLPMSNRHTLLASGWHLPDGNDHTVDSRRAGYHNGDRGGMHIQVSKMKFLGAAQFLENGFLGNIKNLSEMILPIPAFTGSFVMAHNYGDPDNLGDPRNCHDSTDARHPAKGGLANLDRPGWGLDEERGYDNDDLRCFDTAPFRDTHAFNDALNVQVFRSRGPWFMGCRNAQADDPTFDSANAGARPDSTRTDDQEDKIPCQ